MANNGSTNKGIVNSWSLLAFAASHGNMKVGSFINKETGECFKSCVFENPQDKTDLTFVSFSSNMGELTPKEIAARKNELQVVELTPTIDEKGEEQRHYSLCKQGSNAWENVELF